MNSYILLIFNIIRVSFMKLRFRSRACVHRLQRISPLCTLKLFDSGALQIEKNCQFEAGCDLQVHGEGKLVIGQRVYMNRYCMISAHGVVNIGDNCMFGPGVKVFDNSHRFDKERGVSYKLSVGSVKIGNNCWIGSNSIILKGAVIGDNCVIGAGCIINNVIPSGSLVRPNKKYEIEPIHS